jgi:hypothetical protein
MKKRTFIKYAFVFAGILLFAGCSPDPGPEDRPMDPRLKGSWTNGLSDELQKTFQINENGTFEVRLNPGGTMGWGTVKGRLFRRGDDYMMDGVSAECDITDPPGTNWAGMAASETKGKYMSIVFETDDKFKFSSTTTTIQNFFGDTYSRTE